MSERSGEGTARTIAPEGGPCTRRPASGIRRAHASATATGGLTTLVLLATLTAAACGGAGDSAQSSASTDGTTPRATSDDTGQTRAGVPRGDAPRVVLLGTSLTAGLGLDPDSAYPALLQRLADSAGRPARIVNAGLSGETSAGALRRAKWALSEPPAALVILEVGANDGLRGVDPDSTRANLVALIGEIRALQPAARIALVQMEAPPNLGEDYTRRFRAAYPAAAEATGVPLLPFLLEGVAGDPTLNQGDGIHPNEEGARRVAATLWPAIDSLLGVVASGGRAG